MQLILLGVFVFNRTDSAFSVALVGFFLTIPLFILGPFGGLLADSRHRQNILRVTQGLNAAVVITMTVFLNLTDVSYWWAYLVALAVGTSWAFENPTRRSIMLDLHGRAGMVNALALESAAMNASRMAGPALAGLLIELIDVRGAYVVVSILALIAAATFWFLDLKLQPREPSIKQSTWRNLIEGVNYVRKDRTIMAVIFITVIMNLFLFPYMQIMPVIAVDVLQIDYGRMGLLQAVDGFGALIGAVLVAAFAIGIRRHGWVFVGGAALSLSMLLLFTFSRWFGPSLPILLVLGLGTAGFSTMQATIVMLVAREDMRGRALGIISLAIGTGPFGALLIGSIADAVNPTFALRLNALIALGLIALVWVFMRGIRQPTEPLES